MNLFDTFDKPASSLWPQLLARELHKNQAIAEGALPPTTRPGFEDIPYPPFGQTSLATNLLAECQRPRSGWVVGQYIDTREPNHVLRLEEALAADIGFIHFLGALAVLPAAPPPVWLAYENPLSANRQTAIQVADDGMAALRGGPIPTEPSGTVVRADLLEPLGARGTQQLAYALAGLEWRRKYAAQANWALWLPSQWMYLAVGRYFFLELAKVRAMRQLIGRWLLAHEQPAALAAQMRIVGCTSGWTPSLAAPHTNLLRATTEAMSLVLGGADFLLVAPFVRPDHTDYALATRLARNLQHILREEAHLGLYRDAAEGAYILDYLTQSITDQAWAQYQTIEAQGGWGAVLQNGWAQAQIQEAAATRAAQQETFVGVNAYTHVKDSSEQTADAYEKGTVKPWRGPAQAARRKQ